ncbi:MAG: hypothetical protein HIU87_01725 [Acidobacteria bacterium]|nr:hypothetical protein [Acidobacteriota bacterium]
MSPRSLLRSALAAATLCLIPAAAFPQSSGESAVQGLPQSLAATRITRPIDNNKVVTLRGNVHPLAQARFDRGMAPVSMSTGRLILVLKGSQQQQNALKQYLDSVQNPGSPSYRKWLTPEQFGQLFGPTAQDIQTVSSWLQSQGFEIKKVSPARTYIQFSGSLGQVNNAFHTSMHRYNVNGELHTANSTNPQIPVALAPVVAGVAQLNDFFPTSHARQSGAAHWDSSAKRIKPDLTLTDTQGNNYLYVVPADAATIYDTPNSTLNKNYSAISSVVGGKSYDGTGVTIGIAGDSNITTADVGNYRTAFLGEGSTPKLPNVIVDGNDPGITSDEGEALLDTEVSGGIAPGATINFYTSADTDLQQGLFLAILRAVDDNQVSILNVSFGVCEVNKGASGNQFINQLWQQAAAQGISVTVSAGDSGSAGCDNPNTATVATQGLAVSGLASTPYNIAVGGTDFTVLQSSGTAFSQYVDTTTSGSAPYYGTALSYIPETPWNDSTAGNTTISANTPSKDSNGHTNIVAAGGGLSSSAICNFIDPTTGSCNGTLLPYPKPAFQSSVTPSDGVRDLPDVSLLASDGAYGATWAVCLDKSAGGQGTDCLTTNGQLDSNTTFSGVGGTSAAAPVFAGMLALISQSQGGKRLGQADTVLYALAKSNPSVFHDVTTGNNSVYCSGGIQANCGSNSFLTGYDTTAGYDTASGIGSVDVAQLTAKWNSVAFAPTSTNFSINGSTAPLTITHGQSVNFNAAVAPGTATGDVTIQTTSTLPNQAVQPPVLTLTGGSVSGTYNGLPGGSYSVYAYYGGDASNAASSSNQIAVNISPENSILSLQVNIYDPSTGKTFSGGSSQVPYGYYVFSNGQPYGVASSVVNGVVTPDGLPTGTVNFFDNANSISTAAVNASGFARYNNQAFALGKHAISATYSGDPSFNASQAGTSSASTFTIVQASTQTSVKSSASSVTSAGTVTLTATVGTDSLGNAPSGTITFYSGTTAIGKAVAVVGGADPSTGLVNATATLTVTGSQLTSPTTGALDYPALPGSMKGAGAVLLSLSLFFFIPARNRKWRGMLAVLLLIGAASFVTACGSSSGTGNVTPNSRGITAAYNGDTNYASSTSSSISVAVQ